MFHGTPKSFDTLKLNELGILWLAYDQEIAEIYSMPYYAADPLTHHVWAVELKPGTKIIDMEDVDHPAIQVLIKNFNDNPMRNGEITPDVWRNWYCDFATPEAKPWIRGILKRKKFAGAIVNDNTSGKGNRRVEHKSLALFTLTAIQNAVRVL